MNNIIVPSRFKLGCVVFTPRALTTLSQDEVLKALMRHMSGDCGSLDEQDWTLNDEALKFGGRLLSQYRAKDDTRFWIITEQDRSATTILLPDDY